jgi:hypothetical protein
MIKIPNTCHMKQCSARRHLGAIRRWARGTRLATGVGGIWALGGAEVVAELGEPQNFAPAS